MDKLPVTPSPHRFLLPKIKNTSQTKAEPLEHQARQPSAPKNPSEASKRVPASSKLELKPYNTSTITSVISPSNIGTMDPSNRTQKSQSAMDTELKRRTEDGLGVDDAESLVAGKGDGVDAGTTGGRSDGLEARALNAASDGMGKERQALNHEGWPEIRTAKQARTPRGNQFKAAPRFRFGSSQRFREGSPSGAESGINVVSHPTQPRWRATQTPLRQSLRREVTEEEIVDMEGEMLLEVVRQPVELGQMDVDVNFDAEEYGDVTYSKLHAERPVVKKRRVVGDSVESSSNSQTEQRDPTTGYAHQQEIHNTLYDDGAGRNYDDHVDHDGSDDEMLHAENYEQDRNQPPLVDLSHSIPSSRRQPARLVPTHSQRPRFIQPSSHPARPSTPKPQGAQQIFAPTPHFVINDPYQAPSHHDNERQPAHRTFAPIPHFFITTPLPPSTIEDEQQFIKPPKFVHIEEPEPTQPLPEEFSPRKRGQKFVVGGIANEVRGWLVDLESQNQGSNPRARRGERTDEEGWVVQIVVDEVGAGKGVGWTIAKGNGMNVLLGGEGIMEGLEKGKEVQRGAVVKIKAPVWEVEVKGVRWSVGANWRAWER